MIDKKLLSIQTTVEDRLRAFFKEVSTQPISKLFSTQADSLVLTQVCDLTLRGGKRLRAALLIHGAFLFDSAAEKRPAVIDAAAAVELLHTYLLIHDDIMDDDEMRRGGPTVHEALAKALDSQPLGQGLAILAGDLAQALVQVLLANMDLEESRRRLMNRIFAFMHLDVVHGQTLDMLGNADAEEIAARKTASYTTVGPLAAGAAVAGAPWQEIETLAKIALPLGIAFQFRDDLLGIFGSSDVTGKPIGTDLKTGKKTFLLEQGFKLANSRQRQAIEAVLGRADAKDEAIAAAQTALLECGARDACLKRIDDLVEAFKQGIDSRRYLDDGKQFLFKVAQFIAEREE